MLRNEKLYLLPALLVAAQNHQSPVTYMVLSLRLCGLGGDRACRGFLDELRREGLISVERQRSEADQREKVVSITDYGWEALGRFSEIVNRVRDLRRQPWAPEPDNLARLRRTPRAAND